MRSNTVGQALREKIGLPRSEAAALLKEILGCLERGEPVKLSGFGAFTVRKKRERMGRNLRLVRACRSRLAAS